MANEIPSLEKEYYIVSGLFQIATKFSLEFSAEEWALYQTLGPSFNQLKVMLCSIFIFNFCLFVFLFNVAPCFTGRGYLAQICDEVCLQTDINIILVSPRLL